MVVSSTSEVSHGNLGAQNLNNYRRICQALKKGCAPKECGFFGKQGDVDDLAKTRKWKKALMGMHYWQETKVTSFLKDGQVLVRGGNGNCEKKT